MKSLQLLLLCGVMLSTSIVFSQNYPLKTFREVQEPTDMSVTDASPLLGDTIRVSGIAATGPRDIWIGARWSFFLVDTAGGPWSSLQIVQHDSFTTETDVGLVQPGFGMIVTGIVEEFENATQLAVLTNPVVAVDFIDDITLGTFPQRPVEISMELLQETSTGEQYEEVLVKLSNVKMINNDVGGGEGLVESFDGRFQISLEDWNREIYDCFQSSCDNWPANGIPMDVVGYIRDKSAGTSGARFMIAPWSLGLPYIEALAFPPVISDIMRDPAVPSSSDAVLLTASIFDSGSIDAASLNYSVDDGAYVEVPMSSPSPGIFSGTIPAQSENLLVKYYISATDDEDFSSISPGDTARSPLFYIVRDGALTIHDIQYNPFGGGNSGFENMEVTTTGIVTSDSIQYGNYWIQDGNGPWSGLQINDNLNNPSPGDLVQVTGIVFENFGFTRLDAISAYEVIGAGAVPEPRVFSTGGINTNADSAEAYESVLVEVRDVIVSDELPDDPGNFGEFSVDDGSGAIRVDDLSPVFDGNDIEIRYFNGDTLEFVRGYLLWSFGDFKIVPRDKNDVKRGGKFISVKEEGGIMPEEYVLSQNYPNPFNPQTEINYSLPVSGEVRLTVYNLLGQRVVTIVDEIQQAGNYRASWNGHDEFGKSVSSGIYLYNLNVSNGKFSETKKMLLLK